MKGSTVNETQVQIIKATKWWEHRKWNTRGGETTKIKQETLQQQSMKEREKETYSIFFKVI